MNELTREQVALLEETIEGSMKEEPGYGTGWIIHEEEGAAMKAALETIAALRQRAEQAEDTNRIAALALSEAEARIKALEQHTVPYPCWCRHKDQCAGKSSCPEDPTCAD